MRAYGAATSLIPSSWGGKIGSPVPFISYTTKNAPIIRDPMRRLVTSGWDQGSDFPPKLRPPRRQRIVVARRNAPGKSIRRSFEGWPLGAGGWSEEPAVEGRLKATRMIARSMRGAWPTNDH